jgi:Tol biopolymer transport system component
MLSFFSSHSVADTGEFPYHNDIGIVNKNGDVQYDPETQTFLISGSGQNMWFNKDDFHFIWKKMAGDFILTAQFAFIGDGVDPHRKVGWMARKTLDTDSPYADAVLHGDGLTSLQYRRDFDMDTEEISAGTMAPDIIQFERRGHSYIMRAAQFGKPLTTIGSIELELGDSLHVGLAICSHNADVLEKAMVKNLRIDIPAPADFQPYRDYSGSRLEILQVESGARKIVHKSTEVLEAPNWTRDGKALIYNSKGFLHRFDLLSGEAERIDSDFAIRNNNDHVISWDGEKLGISHHMNGEPGGGSTIFTMPITGGLPKRVTDKTPSYFHGWSPDDQFLVYTAERNGQYDIYKIHVNGGEEIRLTNQATLDDGPEYSPDGEWIYFNSARTGTMQLWRMKTDGSDQQQLTFDVWNDWFPHISPDGTTILFLSYPSEIDASDHPHYKHVLLRKMPFAGGEPTVVAYLYGGQGTINVPSWSPDSKKVAFVSYTF